MAKDVRSDGTNKTANLKNFKKGLTNSGKRRAGTYAPNQKSLFS